MLIFKSHKALEHIKQYLPKNPIILEAGSFTGSDTIRMAHMWPAGHIHAFEPVPELFQKLKHRTSEYKNVTCYQYALSNHDGSATFYISEKPDKPGTPSQASSLLQPKKRLEHSPLIFPHTIIVQTITLHTLAKTHNINHLDMLWLDMQGHELAVLQASKCILKTVNVIFTEVSFIESYKNQPQVNKVTQWLQKYGFTCVGQDYVNQKDYFFGNRLFVKSIQEKL